MKTDQAETAIESFIQLFIFNVISDTFILPYMTVMPHFTCFAAFVVYKKTGILKEHTTLI